MPSRFTQYGGVAGAEGALREMVAERLMAEAAQAKAQQQDFENQLKMRALGQTDARIGLDRDEFGERVRQFDAGAAGREAGVLHTKAQTADLERRPTQEADRRAHDAMMLQAKQAAEESQPMNVGPGSVIADRTGRIILRNPAAATPKDPEADLEFYRKKKEIDAQYGGTKPSIGAEKKVLGFYQRAKQATEDIGTMENDIAKMGLLGQGQLQYAPNLLQSKNNQLYRQAQRAFTEARLRKESGAAVPQGEYDNDARTYFAQPGDGPEVIEQKRRAREVVLNGLKFESGKAYNEFYGEQPQGPAAGAGGGQEFDYIPGKGLVPRGTK